MQPGTGRTLKPVLAVRSFLVELDLVEGTARSLEATASRAPPIRRQTQWCKAARPETSGGRNRVRVMRCRSPPIAPDNSQLG